MNTNNKNKNKAIVVLGFHRGGTSATAGSLALSGAVTPNTLIEPVTGENDKGFWESALLSKLNDEILAENGQVWDGLTLDGFCEDRVLDVSNLKINQVRDAICAEYPEPNGPILIKDPRICRLVPVWDQLLRELDYSPVYVLVIRSPNECAQSLARRNNMPVSVSMLLWMQYMSIAERETRNATRVIVQYSELLSQPNTVLEHIGEKLELPFLGNKSNSKAVEEFLDAGLRHHVSDKSDESSSYLRWPSQIYSLMSQLESDTVRQSLENAWNVSDGFIRLFAPIMDERDASIASLTEQLDQALQHRRSSDVAFKAVKMELDSLTYSVAEFERTLSIEQQRYESLINSRLGKTMLFLRKCCHMLQRNRVGASLVFLLRSQEPLKGLLSEYTLITHSGKFDADYYVRCHPDLQWMLIEPLVHYLIVGHKLSYNPNPTFNEADYRSSSKENYDGSGLAHWLSNN